jgi:AcrR family transcriptional regulator
MDDGKKSVAAVDVRPVKRRKSPKGVIRREAILTAAMQHFAKDGYQNASFASIAADVGLSLPGLLHYFPTKVDLLLAILEKRDIESTSATGEDYADWRKVLLGLIDVAKSNREVPQVVQAFSVLNAESLTKDHPARTWFASRASQVKGNFVQSLQRGIEAGELKPDINSEYVAAELISIMDGLQILWLRSPQEFDMVKVFSDYIHRLIASIECR